MTIEELANALPHGFDVDLFVRETTEYKRGPSASGDTLERRSSIEVVRKERGAETILADVKVDDDGSIRSVFVKSGVEFIKVPKVIRELV